MRNKKIIGLLLTAFVVSGLAVGCDKSEADEGSKESIRQESTGALAGDIAEEHSSEVNTTIIPDLEINQLEQGFSAVLYDGDYWFDIFLEQGGASSDSDVLNFLTGQLQLEDAGLVFETSGFGCSTLAVRDQEGRALFGRNFDWEKSEALVVKTNPDSGGKRYASISTVNMDFIRTGYGAGLEHLPDEIRTMIALYAPLDGMNESGLAVSVNMIQDSAVINQNTEKPDITTTTAIRLILDKAADVDEALALLEQYDMHSSMAMMVHFALADKSGRSVVVEYIGAEGDEMVVTETPAVTNFYLAPGEKQGIGSSQSHTRYEILMKQLSEQGTMGIEEVRDALDSVSKDNFGEAVSSPDTGLAENFESTEWSIVFSLDSGEARYYHRENYENSYTFHVNK